MKRRRILSYAKLAEPARRTVQLPHRLAATRQESLLEHRIDPRAGDDAGTIPGAAPGEEGALPLDLLCCQCPLVEQRTQKHLQQSLVVAQTVLQPRDSLLERAVMRRLRNAEEVVVVAALLTDVLDHKGMVRCIERSESDGTDVLIEPVF